MEDNQEVKLLPKEESKSTGGNSQLLMMVRAANSVLSFFLLTKDLNSNESLVEQPLSWHLLDICVSKMTTEIR